MDRFFFFFFFKLSSKNDFLLTLHLFSVAVHLDRRTGIAGYYFKGIGTIVLQTTLQEKSDPMSAIL